MSQYVPDSNAPVPIESYEQLVSYFQDACKPRFEWKIGTEYEKLAVYADGRAVPFSGPAGIEALLQRLSDRYGWDPIPEKGHIVALRRGQASITLEPGGQVELSGEPWPTIHQAAEEFRQHVEEILAVSKELGIYFLGLGMQPFSRLEEIEWVPKRRYEIMAPYMLRVGSLGHRMMKQTATVQVNLDFGSEADAMAKMRVATGLVPLLAAMYANSPLSDGDLNGYLSYRGHVWTDTDPDRCGLLRFVFTKRASFADYVEYALDVPMYFIVRDGWIDMTAYTFREFLRKGYGAHRATMADWNSHLTTLFPEVRMKQFIEVRAADSPPLELVLSIPALVKGVFYWDDAREAAWDLVKRWSWEELVALYHDVHRAAHDARIRGIRVRDLCRELLDIAEYGLQRQGCVNEKGENEALYLERLIDQVRKGLCPAQQVRERWIGPWNREPRRMVEALAYRREALAS